MEKLLWNSNYKSSSSVIYIIGFFFVCMRGVITQEDSNGFTYNVAIVEYHPVYGENMSSQERTNMNAQKYIQLLEEVKKDVDIMQFPEATLTSLLRPLEEKEVTEVPEVFSENLCNSSNTKYLPFLKQLSCAAINTNTTLIINLVEKVNCTSNNASGYCPSTGFLYHNTDVVLNEEGSVSARYRKFNLYGEAGLSPTPEPEISNFTIRNITFGLFTCFDLLFEKPALELTRNGIRNIFFPTMWFSQIPYLTALQAQQMWAQENNVTLISSNANNPSVGGGGSGIFVGYKGPVNYTIVGGKGGTGVLVQKVPRIEVSGNPFMDEILPLEEDIDSLAVELDGYYLKQDHTMIAGHTSKVLNISANEHSEEVCNGDTPKICCHFHLKTKTASDIPKDKNIYTYHLAAFSGLTHYTNTIHGGIEACALLACLNDSVTSCGRRFPNFTDISWPVTFEYINVSAEFEDHKNKIHFPNSLLASLRPISPQHTLWNKEDLGEKVRRSHLSNIPQSRVLTFGIYGRDFTRDGVSSSAPERIQLANMISSIFLLLLLMMQFE